uniref:CPSF_A domain-containing protein n=1 Tax=Macrostomum lignano TaxID=282301 RepID=A0A1I8IBT9_9PLAT
CVCLHDHEFYSYMKFTAIFSKISSTMADADGHIERSLTFGTSLFLSVSSSQSLEAVCEYAAPGVANDITLRSLSWEVQLRLITCSFTPMVPDLAFTPHRKAVAVPALSGVCMSVLYVFERPVLLGYFGPVAQVGALPWLRSSLRQQP